VLYIFASVLFYVGVDYRRDTWINKSASWTRRERYCKIRALVSVANLRVSVTRIRISENKREAKNIVWEIRQSAINKSRLVRVSFPRSTAIKSCALFSLEEIYQRYRILQSTGHDERRMAFLIGCARPIFLSKTGSYLTPITVFACENIHLSNPVFLVHLWLTWW